MRARLGALLVAGLSVAPAARATPPTTEDGVVGPVELGLDGCEGVSASDVRRIVHAETMGLRSEGTSTSAPVRVTIRCARDGDVLDVHIRATRGEIVGEREGRFTGTAAERARFVGLAASELVVTMRASERSALPELPAPPPLAPQVRAAPDNTTDERAAPAPAPPAPAARFRLGVGFGGLGVPGEGGALLLGGRAAGGVFLGRTLLVALDGTYHRGEAARRAGSVELDAATVGLWAGGHVIGTRGSDVRLICAAGVRGGSFGVEGRSSSTSIPASGGRRFGIGPTSSVELSMLHPIEITVAVEAGYMTGGVRAIVFGEEAVRTTGAYLALHLGFGIRSER